MARLSWNDNSGIVADAWSKNANATPGHGRSKLALADVEAGKASPLSQLRD
jgi:hypothetical protein